MDNHVHLVIEELEVSISRIVKRIGTSYASYKSEPIEDEKYLLSAIRYVHNNPVKAGICKIQDYKWSSYRFYIQEVNK
jgi:putative transposase